MSMGAIPSHTPVAIRGTGGLDMSTNRNGNATQPMLPLPRLSLTPMRTPAARQTIDLGSLMENDDTSAVKRLNFNLKDCQTPARYAPRHRIGEPVQVFLRVRPLLEHEQTNQSSLLNTLTVENDTAVSLVAPKDSAAFKTHELTARFTFSRIFGHASSQEEVYEHAALPLVNSFWNGQNGLIFAYGITS